MTQVWQNGATGRLASPITTVSTQLTLEAGQGALFPSPSGSQYMVITIEDVAGVKEVIKSTSRSGDVIQLSSRAQESTSLQNFAAGSRVEIRVTAGGLNNFLQADSATLTGAMNAGTQNINSVGTLQATVGRIGTVRSNTYRADDNGTTNQIQIPDGGGSPTLGGSLIVTVANAPTTLAAVLFPPGAIVLWSGSLLSIPVGWVLCDGTGGTPDLRDRFVVGAGNSYAVGASGGAITATTSATDGTVGLTVTVAGHVLTVAELPSHGHPMRLSEQSAATARSDTTGGLMLNTGTNVDHVAYNGAVSATAGQQIGGTGSDAAHSHGATVSGGATHTHTVDTRSPYYALAYIMKT